MQMQPSTRYVLILLSLAKLLLHQGQFQDGLRHGRGTYRFPTGEVVVASWSRGQISGRGNLEIPTEGGRVCTSSLAEPDDWWGFGLSLQHDVHKPPCMESPGTKSYAY
jgi:hypothetical protein